MGTDDLSVVNFLDNHGEVFKAVVILDSVPMMDLLVFC